MVRGRPSFLVDVWNGAVRGDFAPRLGIAGVVTQVIFGFTPILGTLCALRDLIADWRHRDRVGVLLNALAFVPLLGGFPKMVEAVRGVHQVGRVLHVTYHARQACQASQASQENKRGDARRPA
jgi:hypothetical protein